MPRVFVGIGSNIEREANVRGGVADLREQFGDLQLSAVYESEAVGFEGDPFYNLVAAFDTDKPVEAVVESLATIEDRHGRVRNVERFSGRTLDIDLLLYGDLVASTERFHVPRDEIPRYAFVLKPLAEMAPQMRHPQSGECYADMWAGFDQDSQALRMIAFDWD